MAEPSNPTRSGAPPKRASDSTASSMTLSDTPNSHSLPISEADHKTSYAKDGKIDALATEPSPAKKRKEKAWMESDKDELPVPDNDMRLVMPALLITLFLSALDQTIVSTALPTIAEKLHATPSQYSWCGSSYLLANTILLPLYGRMSDIVGRKAVLYPGILFFVIGSALCGAAQSMNMLIGARAVQGIGGGSIMALTQIILADIVPLSKRGLWNGFMGGLWGLASVFGPIFGGLLTERASWRWCFFINLPTAGVALAMLFFFLKLNPSHKLTWDEFLRTFDFLGLVTIMLGVALLCVGFSEASDLGFDDKITIALLVVGAFLVACAIINFLFTKRNAIIPRRVLTTRTTVLLLLASTLQAMAFLSASFYFPVFFQAIKGASPLLSGVYLLPFSFMVAIATIVAGQVNSRLKIVRPVAWVGYAMGALGFGLCIKYLSYGASLAAQEISIIVAAFGVGLSLGVPLLMIQAAMPFKETASSTGAWMLTRSMGGTMGIAIFQAVQLSGLRSRFPKLEGFGTDFTIPQNLKEYQQIYNLPHGPMRDAALTAFSDALRLCYIIWCPFLGAALILSLFTKHYTMNRVAGSAQNKEKGQESGDLDHSSSKGSDVGTSSAADAVVLHSEKDQRPVREQDDEDIHKERQSVLSRVEKGEV